eukprot:5405876-Lingulodinium_polyedra.AAC.1
MHRPLCSQLHAATAAALQCLEVWRAQPVARWAVYVDGSSSREAAGWGIVVIARCVDGRQRYAGAAWGDA